MVIEGFGKYTETEAKAFKKWFYEEIGTDMEIKDFGEGDFGVTMFDIETNIELAKIRNKEINMIGEDRHKAYCDWLES